jgi:hypothetical protein
MMMQRSPESPGIYIAIKVMIVAMIAPQIVYRLFGNAPIEIPKTTGSRINSIQLKSARPRNKNAIPVPKNMKVRIIESRKLLSFNILVITLFLKKTFALPLCMHRGNRRLKN